MDYHSCGMREKLNPITSQLVLHDGSQTANWITYRLTEENDCSVALWLCSATSEILLLTSLTCSAVDV